jgi:Ca2+-binding RTX toxin-like protein
MAVTFRQSHEDARRLIEAAPKGELDLPAYTGSNTNLSYLRSYVATHAADLYGVSASVFNTPTLFSTSLLRDFIHRAVYHNDSTIDYHQKAGSPQFDKDVGAALRDPAYGLCGLLSWQMFTVFEAFGYDARRLTSVDGSLPRTAAQSDDYFLSHAITEVYLSDMGGYALQDATFNVVYLNESGVPQSLYEFRREQYVADDPTWLDFTTSYANYQRNGYRSVAEIPGYAGLITAAQAFDWFNVPESWTTKVSNGWQLMGQFYEKSPVVFGSREAAIDALNDVRSMGWEAAHEAISASRDVWGFRIYSPDTGRVTSEWLTVGIPGGKFISMNLGTGVVLNGTYDQMLAEASGYGENRNASNVDLSFLFNPAGFIGPSGNIGYDWEAAAFATPLNAIGGTSASNLLSSSSSADLMEGGRGNDVYHVNDADDLVWEAAGGGYDKVLTTTSYELSPNTRVEYLGVLSRGSSAPINLTANSFTELMAGNAGANVFFGSERAQKMFGYGGNDTYYVNRRQDIVNESSGQGHDRVYTTTTYILSNSSAVEDLAVTSSETTNTINLTGNDLGNVITGNDGRNQITGRMGKDTLIGLDGNDVYVVGGTGTKIMEAADEGNDTVYSLINFALGANQHVEVLRVGSVSSSKTITLYGNGLQKQIVGHEGHNILDPGDHTGPLTMYGKGNNDTYYVYQATDLIVETTGVDRVYAVGTDYTLGTGVSIELLATAQNETGAFDLTGNELAQRIVGNGAANVLEGGGGDDIFQFAAALNGSTNVDTIVDYVVDEDQVWLSQTVFAGLGSGPLAVDAFHSGAGATTATDPAHRIIYNTSTGDLRFDSDGDGPNTAVRFAILTNTPALTHDDFIVV